MHEVIKDLMKDPSASVLIGLVITTMANVGYNVWQGVITRKDKKVDNLSDIKVSLDEIHKSVNDLKSRQDAIELSVKRTELQISIDNDYGKQTVGKVFDEYTELGGNSYMHDRFEKYMDSKSD